MRFFVLTPPYPLTHCTLQLESIFSYIASHLSSAAAAAAIGEGLGGGGGDTGSPCRGLHRRWECVPGNVCGCGCGCGFVCVCSCLLLIRQSSATPSMPRASLTSIRPHASFCSISDGARWRARAQHASGDDLPVLAGMDARDSDGSPFTQISRQNRAATLDPVSIEAAIDRLGGRHISDGSSRFGCCCCSSCCCCFFFVVRVRLNFTTQAFLPRFSLTCAASAPPLDSDTEEFGGWGGSVGGDVPMLDSPRWGRVGCCGRGVEGFVVFCFFGVWFGCMRSDWAVASSVSQRNHKPLNATPNPSTQPQTLDTFHHTHAAPRFRP